MLISIPAYIFILGAITIMKFYKRAFEIFPLKLHKRYTSYKIVS